MGQVARDTDGPEAGKMPAMPGNHRIPAVPHAVRKQAPVSLMPEDNTDRRRQ